MRIGYPCINRAIGCSGGRTFRLASYTEARLEKTIATNLACLARILQYNAEHRLLFFRITSDLVPFASHAVMHWPWQQRFADEFAELGGLIKDNRIRISMHPDQFVVPSSPYGGVRERSAAELRYHAEVLDLLGCGRDAKCQIHLGGAYGDRLRAIDRFVEAYAGLDDAVRDRLVIENDDRIFSVADCLRVSEQTGAPVLFDVFHHLLLGGGESIGACLASTKATWRSADGVPMVDYSSQDFGKRPGAHAAAIDTADFERFLAASRPVDIDVMLEIKDKERSALVAAAIAARDPRFVG